MNPWPAGSWLVATTKLETPEGKQSSNAFYEAIYEATDILRNDPNSMKLHLAEYTLIDQDVAQKAPNIAFTKANEADFGALQGYSDLLLKEGFIKQPIDTSKLLITKTD